jgi:LytS/YehU family sensor histidine kinase
MFNALSSIQNLMNRNEAVAANHYLTIFSSLTRRVLNTGDQELISLEDEISLLDDYLQMEQLRFGFKYSINVVDELNKANIEIPAMLLQPLVENAVKHGVSSLRDKGTIEVAFEKNNKALVLSVSDNGNGFDENNIALDDKGLGLKLSRERITLLNKIYSKQLITMEFNAVNSGTKVNVILNDWL